MVENDRVRNGNREALTALRKRARTTKTSVPSPFESIMKEIEGMGSKPLVKEVCATCGNHDSTEKTWMMFHGTDIFARIPFHAAHTILEKGTALPLLYTWSQKKIHYIFMHMYNYNIGSIYGIVIIFMHIYGSIQVYMSMFN